MRRNDSHPLGSLLWAAMLCTLLPDSTVVLARYTYDGLGRRVAFEDPVAGRTTLYYYDDASVIEERDGSDARLAYHVNGAQFVDERIMTYTDPTGGLPGGGTYTYYLQERNFSVVGTGDAEGAAIEHLDFSPGGDFAQGCTRDPAWMCDGDVDGNGAVNPVDSGLVQANYCNPGACTDEQLCQYDMDCNGAINPVDTGLVLSLFGTCNAPRPVCESGGEPPPSGTFTLHGRPLDVLSDGHALLYVRARYYDPARGRWLQRDPSGYVDGNNLYEAFQGNPTRNVDPLGTEVREFGRSLEDSSWAVLGYGRGLAWRVSGWNAEDLIDTLGAILELLVHADLLGESDLVSDLQTRAGVLRGEVSRRVAAQAGMFHAGTMAGPRTRGLILDPGGATSTSAGLFEYRDRQLEDAVITSLEGLLATINEPADWVLTAREMYTEGFSPYQLAAFLPVVSGSWGKAFRGADDAGRVVIDAARSGDRARLEEFLRKGGYAGRSAERMIEEYSRLRRVIETQRVLEGVAGEALASVQRAGRPAAHGTRVHTVFARRVSALGLSQFRVEVSYLNGLEVRRGTPGSIRVDVAEGSFEAPTAIYDLKTGTRGLTPARISEIRRHLPAGSKDIPILEIRP